MELRIVTEVSRVSGKMPEYVSRVNHVFFCSRRGSLRTMSTIWAASRQLPTKLVTELSNVFYDALEVQLKYRVFSHP